MYGNIVVPSVVWMLSARERKRVDVTEIKCLRSICGVRRTDRGGIFFIKRWK